MQIRHIISSLDARHGGPPLVAIQLAAAQRRLGCRVGVISQEDPARIPQTLAFVEQTRPGASQLIQLEEARGALQRRLGFAAARATRQTLEVCDARDAVLHIHGLWNISSLLAARHARRMKIPYIVRPAGMLEPWCLAQKPVRKRLALSFGYRHMLSHAAAIHATSQQEAANIRQLGVVAPIAVIPNGVDASAELSASLQASRETQPQRTLLFLSRIQRKKGLLNLVEAWSAVQSDFPQWRVVIAGPDEDNHQAEVQAAVLRSSARDVTFAGAVFADAKQQLLANSHMLVLPTQSENFGVVVAEALAVGLPVITTTAAPWQELEARRCGWWTGVDAAALTETLRTALQTTGEARRKMGVRGHRFVKEKFAWPRIAERTVKLYHAAKGSTPLPDFVDVSPAQRSKKAA